MKKDRGVIGLKEINQSTSSSNPSTNQVDVSSKYGTSSNDGPQQSMQPGGGGGGTGGGLVDFWYPNPSTQCWGAGSASISKTKSLGKI